MAGMTAAEVLREAERRFHFDAEFHARCKQVANLLAFDLSARTGGQMAVADVSLALHAASVALVVGELDPITLASSL